jgi:hypothetical protein
MSNSRGISSLGDRSVLPPNAPHCIFGPNCHRLGQAIAANVTSVFIIRAN